MVRRSPGARAAWLLLLALGCSGLGNGGGCGCGSCEPIPGGFPASERQNNAVLAKLTKSGLGLLETQLGAFIQGNGGTNIGYPLQCTASGQRVLGINFDLALCDLNHDFVCNSADAAMPHPDEPPHGYACAAQAAITSLDLTPTQAADGTVDIAAVMNVKVNTGRLYVGIRAPPRTIFGQQISNSGCEDVRCSVEYDSDEVAPTEIPITARIKLKPDPNWGDILALEVLGLDDLGRSIDANEIHIESMPGGTCSVANSLGLPGPDAICGSVLDSSLVKQLIVQALQSQITKTLKDQVDTLRCAPCEAGTRACPGGSYCKNDLCYATGQDPDQDRRGCVPAKLGVEGRTNLGSSLASFGGPGSAVLDLSLVAGGRNPDGTSATRVQNGGVVIGLMGGSRTPEPSRCVPAVPWTARTPQGLLDFDAEATAASIPGYSLGLSLGDNFLDKSMYDLWASGAVCLDVDRRVTSFLSSGLFGTFIRTLPGATHGEDVPMMISLRPRKAPNMVIGLGTTKPGPNGTTVPDDPLLTLQMDELYIDFYAFIEERYVRLFSLVTDVRLPLGLEFDASAGTIQPVLAGLDTLITNVHATNIELLSDDAADLEAVIPQIIGLVQPQLAGAIAPIALPAIQGARVSVKGARGAVKFANAPGYEHLALFAELAMGQPLVARADTEATLTSSTIPTSDEAFHGASPTARIHARGLGVLPVGGRWQYSYRLDGGFWGPWQGSSVLDVSAPVLKLQGRHTIDVRARASGDTSTADLTPASVAFVVDYDPPQVALERASETNTVETRAHDAVTPEAALQFRYRIGAGEWSALGPARAFDLGSLGQDDVLEVVAIDEAGHAGRATFGQQAADSLASVPMTPDNGGSGGCSAAQVSALALVALVASMLRRRSRR